jgi:DEAD/DEAH box helicase domain-containing protein
MDDLLDVLLALDEHAQPAGGRLVHVETIPARAARYAEPSKPFPDLVRDALGVTSMWSHQAEAIDHLREGRSVVIATGTASGKSLAFQAPIAEAVLSTPSGTALLIYPTKALAQDQLRALHAMGVPGMVAATYDGDTGTEARAWIRRSANVILTNPEMLHTGVLPTHARWATFLRRLRYVVVDELHVLRGVFGTHVAHVLRRLRRLCNRYGSDPVFVFTSATIGEPEALATSLCGLPVVAVTDDGSPRGERLLALWNPPLLDGDAGIRASANGETARIVAGLVGTGHRTVAFCRSRRGTEVVAAEIRRHLRGSGHEDSIRSYRAGYLAEERRRIEAGAVQRRGAWRGGHQRAGAGRGHRRAGRLRGERVPGHHGVVPSAGGACGRAQQRSLAVLVCGNDQLDQWLADHPAEMVLRPPEPAVINLANPFVAAPQVACGAYEAGLSPDDAAWWPADVLDDAVRGLVIADVLRLQDGKAYWAGRGAPAPGIGLRSGTADEVRIVDADARLVGTVDAGRAPEVVHPGALYLHLGQQWRVKELDLADRVAWVEQSDAEETTSAAARSPCGCTSADATMDVGLARLSVGAVEVTSQVVGYERRDARTRELIGREELDLPPTRLQTRAFWYAVDDEVFEAAGVDPSRVPGTLHAAEHAGIGILPLFTICDRWDVGGVSTGVAARDRAAHDRDLRRLPGRGGHRRAGLLRRAAAPARHAGRHRAVRCAAGARRACSRPSAATATSRSTRPAPWRCCARCCGHDRPAADPWPIVNVQPP